MFFEDAQDMMDLYNIDPSLTCTCDEVHECQQCYEERKSEDDSESLEQYRLQE
jgi:hypothetical protein